MRGVSTYAFREYTSRKLSPIIYNSPEKICTPKYIHHKKKELSEKTKSLDAL